MGSTSTVGCSYSMPMKMASAVCGHLQHCKGLQQICSIAPLLAASITCFCGCVQVAEQFRDEPGMWFPHNMDFRGRAYPMPPHLNHLGSDTSRGILQFAEGRALGKHGLEWLYIQVEQPPLPPWLPTCFLSPGVAYGLSLPLETSPAAFRKVQRGGCVAFLAPCTLPHLCRPYQPISLNGTASHLAPSFTAKNHHLCAV